MPLQIDFPRHGRKRPDWPGRPVSIRIKHDPCATEQLTAAMVGQFHNRRVGLILDKAKRCDWPRSAINNKCAASHAEQNQSSQSDLYSFRKPAHGAKAFSFGSPPASAGQTLPLRRGCLDVGDHGNTRPRSSIQKRRIICNEGRGGFRPNWGIHKHNQGKPGKAKQRPMRTV